VHGVIAKTLPGAQVFDRVTGYGLAAAADRSAAVSIIGLDPQREQRSSVLTVGKGRVLAATPAKEIVVAEKLAARLKVKLGDELVLLSQAADGSMANDLYTVVGLSTGGMLDAGGGSVFLHLADAQSFFALGAGVHQVTVNLEPGEDPDEAAAALRTALGDETLEALSWNEMVPELKMSIEADRQGTFAVDAIVFLLVVLGMLNAMTMATYERMFELGVLSGLGTRPGRILAMILTEAMCLGLVSLAAGLAIGTAAMELMPPLDLSGYGEGGFGGAPVPSQLTVKLAPLAVVMALVTVGVTCFFGGLYPAWRASRLKPVEAMRARA
jgi:ABC-type lipoprotein release transport system permease subunit